MGSGPAGLYLHIPFCQRKCAYCDFYSTTDLDLRAPFLTAMLSEIRRTVGADLTFDTLYVGGGTPSVLAPDVIAQLVHSAQKHLRFGIDPEITIEVNPGTVDSAVLSKYRQCGINRINIGVQSFDPLALKLLGRIHSTQAARTAVQEARSAGFNNIGLDLMYALPGQTEQAWRSDLKQALAFAPEHLACYMLTYEPGTPIDAARQAGELQPLDDAASGDLFDITMRVLEDHGYEHYEISNFARQGPAQVPSRRSRHNQKYWTFQPYIGLGPSAHSFQPPYRSWNGRDVHQYVAMIEAGRSPEAGRETLTHTQQLTEFIYLRLRCVDGIDWVQGQEWFGLDLHAILASELSQFEQEGLLRIEAERCSLTRKGMHVADSIAARLIARI
jgi:oxygen-independent coproporphyrinogen-3 oxidase